MRSLVSTLLVITLLSLDATAFAARPTPKLSPSVAAQIAYADGVAALQRHDLSGAEVAFARAVKLSPANPQARNSLGFVLMLERKTAAARAELQAATRLWPAFQAAWINLAEAEVQAGELPAAIRAFRQAKSLGALDSAALSAFARVLSLHGDTDEAITEVRAALEISPDVAQLHDDMGSLRAQQKRFDQAEKEFVEAEQLDPGLKSPRLHRGVLLLDKDSDAAIAELKSAREAGVVAAGEHLSAGQTAQADYYLALALGKKEDNTGALAALQEALKLKPDWPDAQAKLGLLLQRTGETEQAIAAFSRVVRLSPDDPEAHNNLGLAFMQTAEMDSAVTELETAIKLRPQDVGYRNNLGAALLQKADFDAAIQEYKIALRRAPSNGELHYNLGLALKLKDQMPEAISELRKAAQLNPELPDAHYTLGVTLWQKGDFEESAKELQAVIAIRPDYAEAYYTLGTVFKQMGKLPEAKEALGQAIHLQPEFAGAHTVLASVLRELGDRNGALLENEAAARIMQSKTNLQAATFATNFGKKLANSGDLKGATAQFESAIRSDPDYAPAHWQLGLALKQQGKDKDGEAELDRAAGLDAKFKREKK